MIPNQGIQHGPNVQRLIAHNRTIYVAAANHVMPTRLVGDAIGRLKQMPENPYGDDDEAIAAALLRGIQVWESMFAFGLVKEEFGDTGDDD